MRSCIMNKAEGWTTLITHGEYSIGAGSGNIDDDMGFNIDDDWGQDFPAPDDDLGLI